jgi:hypothetical protein
MKCDKCGRDFPEHLLDAKPSSALYKKAEILAQSRPLSSIRGQSRALSSAANRGNKFDRLECKECYGPEWAEGPRR